MFKRLTHNTQLYKNQFCRLVLIPVVIDNIRSKCGTFDWLMAKYWVGCLQEAFKAYSTFSFLKHCSLFSFGYSDILKFIIFNKIKCFPKLIPTSWHKPVYLSEIQTKYLCLHYIGSLGSLKKRINKICKEISIREWKEMFSFTNMYI